MKDIKVHVVRTGRSENLSGAFVSKDDAIEYIVERVKDNSGAHPAVKLEGAYGIRVPDGWTRSRDSHRVYVLLQHMHEGSAGLILGFHTTRNKARKAMKLRSRYFPEQGRDFVPRLKIVPTDLYAYMKS